MAKCKRKVAVVTDSSSSVTQAMAQEYGVHVLPLYVAVGGRTYRDGIDLGSELFYPLLRASKQLPTTSQLTVLDFVQAYSALSDQAEAIVSIHVSQKLSATVDSARVASRQLPEVPVHVIDSHSVSMGLGLMVIAASHAAAAGQDAAGVIRVVEELIPKINLIFTLETLEYLHKGGRIGGASALLGSVLSINPVLHLTDGRIEPFEKPRTKKRAVQRILNLMGERVGRHRAVHASVVHAAAADEAQVLAEEVAARFHPVELLTADIGPVLSTHAGPGALGVAFYAD